MIASAGWTAKLSVLGPAVLGGTAVSLTDALSDTLPAVVGVPVIWLPVKLRPAEPAPDNEPVHV